MENFIFLCSVNIVECTYELVKSPSENPECNLEDHLVIWSSDLHSGFSGGVDKSLSVVTTIQVLKQLKYRRQTKKILISL